MLIRSWGRIGSRGSVKMQSFGTPLEATIELTRIRRAKLRRGYVDASPTEPAEPDRTRRKVGAQLARNGKGDSADSRRNSTGGCK